MVTENGHGKWLREMATENLLRKIATDNCHGKMPRKFGKQKKTQGPVWEAKNSAS